VAGEQRGFVLGCEIAVVGNAFVVVVRHQVENVFLQVRAGAADAVDFVLANHLRQRNAEFSRTHGAGDGHEHLAARIEQLFVIFGRVDQGRRIEMAIVQLDKRRDG